MTDDSDRRQERDLKQELRKIVFPEDRGIEETLLLTPLGDELWRLDQTPERSGAAACGDTICAKQDAHGSLWFVCLDKPAAFRSERFPIPMSFLSSRAWFDLRDLILQAGGQCEEMPTGDLVLHVPWKSNLNLASVMGVSLVTAERERGRERRVGDQACIRCG
jgi:hypothetical protein